MKSGSVGLPPKMDANYAYRSYEGVEYKEFWNERKKHNLDLLERDIIRSLLPVSGHRIVDIGCGFGRLADCYLDRFEQVVMLDGSATLLRQAQEVVGKRAIYIAADANRLPFSPSSFDCALLIRIFHHLPESQVILAELKRILSFQGVLGFNYCNKLSPRQIMLWILHRKRGNPLTLDPVVGPRFITHHPKYVHQLLTQNGYSDIQYLGSGVFDKIPDVGGYLLPLAKLFAPVFGFTKLAPWINCRTVSSSGKVLDTTAKVEDIFICPACHGSLTHLPKAYVCKPCEHIYPTDDGIIDFRIETNGYV
jgi:ubiquinone/menaquinone biosynthesis C-methylase UbiE